MATSTTNRVESRQPPKEMRPDEWLRKTGFGSLLLSLPWCWILPAALSTLSVGGAVTARWVVGWLMPVLFVVSIVLLLYAHYRAWWHYAGPLTTKVILLINTGLVVWLWYGRLGTMWR